MKKLFFLILALFLAGQAAAEVQYQINAGKEQVKINSTVELDCSTSCPGLTWLLPDDSEILEVRDGKGEIEDYTVKGNKLKISGQPYASRDKRVILIRLKVTRDAEEIHSGLYKRTLTLSGFSDERTTGKIKADNLISGRTGYGFQTSFENDKMVFKGEGPVNVRIKFGKGYETNYFVFFGSKPTETEIAYEIPIGTLGVVQNFKRFPVAVMNDTVYEKKVNKWSAGEYIGGAIQIRSKEGIGKDFIPVLAHEVVHGLNDRILNWDQTRSSYFDEGTGKYVEFLVKRKIKGSNRVSELFGDEVSWVERRDGQRYRITLPPKGDKEVLWNYYQNDRSFMKSWSALESSPETRDFGYAYSELIIRNYVARMNGSLKSLYDKLNPGRNIQSTEEKWRFFSQFMDMTPCKFESRKKFESCLDTINSNNYPVYSAKPVRNGQGLSFERVQIPNNTSKGVVPTKDVSFSEFLSGFFKYLLSLLESLAQFLDSI